MSVGYEFYRLSQPSDFKPSCGQAIPPLTKYCAKPSAKFPTIENTYPGWWNGPYDYFYGMNNYTKHTKTDDSYVPYQDMVEQNEGNEIDFYLKDAADMRWNNWPGTTTFVGDVEMGEVVAPPGMNSTLKINEGLAWRHHTVPMKEHECKQPIQDLWDLAPITRADKTIHYGNQ